MKSTNLIVLGLAGLAVYMIVKKTPGGLKGMLPGTGNGQGATAPTTEVFNASGLPWDNGWRYYSDGTAIDPQGRYYKNGSLIWSPQ